MGLSTASAVWGKVTGEEGQARGMVGRGTEGPVVGTPTPSLMASAPKAKGRVLFLAPVGPGDNGRLAFHRPAEAARCSSALLWLFLRLTQNRL